MTPLWTIYLLAGVSLGSFFARTSEADDQPGLLLFMFLIGLVGWPLFSIYYILSGRRHIE